MYLLVDSPSDPQWSAIFIENDLPIPKFLYFFLQYPSCPTQIIFSGARRIGSVFLSGLGEPLSWPNQPCTFPYHKVVWLCPASSCIIEAAVVVTVRWWFYQRRHNPAVTLEAAVLGSCVALGKLVLRGPSAHLSMTGSMQVPLRVWGQAHSVYGEPSKFSPHLPLLGNPVLPHLYSIPDSQLWPCHGVLTLKHVIANGRVVPFADLRQEHSLPSSMGFRYWELNHALRMQFPEPIVLESDPVERGLTSRVMSSLYLCLSLAYDTKFIPA